MAAPQDLMAAMGVLYRGYLYGLIAGIIVLIVSIPTAVALIAYGGRMGATALITDVLIFALAAVRSFCGSSSPTCSRGIESSIGWASSGLGGSPTGN